MIHPFQLVLVMKQWSQVLFINRYDYLCIVQQLKIY